MTYENYIDPSPEVSEKEAVYNVNKELSLARRIVENTSSNLFLTGKAGTGKTTFLRKLQQETFKRMVILAPTGVAAINAGGMTIHSFFQFSFSPFIPGQGFAKKDSSFRFSKDKARLIRSLDLLVIDEISMVRPDIMDAIDDSLRRIRHSDRPFGGVQLLLIGDLRQLSPVKIEQEWSLLRAYYPSEFFFESHALKRAGFLTIELQEIYRQSDPGFIRILNGVRDGSCDSAMLEELNKRYIPHFDPDDSENYIRLTSHNYRANSINEARMNALPTEDFIFNAEVNGSFPQSSYPAEQSLRLREGAQVMFIKNDPDPDKRFYNGMIGTVVEISDGLVYVAPSDGSPVIAVGNLKWENKIYVIDEKTKEIKEETAGTFSQIPLRPAWAITIHKSQGLTFSRAVIDAAAAFAPGQTYVALSRCKSLDGLVLDSPLSRSAIMVDCNVNRFMENESRNRPDEEMMINLSRQYIGDMVCELFSFESLRRAFEDYSRLESEFIANLLPNYHISLTEAGKILKEEVYPVGIRFAGLYRNAFRSPLEGEGNDSLMDKIKRGCRYFSEKLMPLQQVLATAVPELDNAADEKRFSAALGTLSELLFLKDELLKIFSDSEFSPESYLSAKAQTELEITKSEGGKKRNRSGNAPSDIENKELFDALSAWRRDKAEERNLPAFTIMSNSAIKEISSFLPESAEDLMEIPGLGKTRISLYGGEILEIVEAWKKSPADFKADKSASGKKRKEKAVKPKTPKEPKIKSDIVSLGMWKEGKKIIEIAEERELSVQTIFSHLLKHTESGDVTLGDIINLDLLNSFREKIPDLSQLNHEIIESARKEIENEIGAVSDYDLAIVTSMLFHQRRQSADNPE